MAIRRRKQALKKASVNDLLKALSSKVNTTSDVFEPAALAKALASKSRLDENVLRTLLAACATKASLLPCSPKQELEDAQVLQARPFGASNPATLIQ